MLMWKFGCFFISVCILLVSLLVCLVMFFVLIDSRGLLVVKGLGCVLLLW